MFTISIRYNAYDILRYYIVGVLQFFLKVLFANWENLCKGFGMYCNNYSTKVRYDGWRLIGDN